MKALLFIISILLFALTYSCNHQKTCPEFDIEDLQLIPFMETDTLEFMNPENELFSIVIQKFELSESHTVEWKGVKALKEEACLNFVEINASDSRNTTSYIFLKMEQSDVSEMQYFKYQLLDFYFEIDFDNEVPFINDFDDMELVPTLSINDTVYSDVIRYLDIANSSVLIQTVYLNKKDGILKFIEEVDGVEWVLVD